MKERRIQGRLIPLTADGLFFDFTPPAHVVGYVDPRTDTRFTKRLQEARQRQAERDAMHEAWIENLFYGQPYKSVAEELGMSDAEFMASLRLPR